MDQTKYMCCLLNKLERPERIWNSRKLPEQNVVNINLSTQSSNFYNNRIRIFTRNSLRTQQKYRQKHTIHQCHYNFKDLKIHSMEQKKPLIWWKQWEIDTEQTGTRSSLRKWSMVSLITTLCHDNKCFKTMDCLSHQNLWGTMERVFL